MSLKQKLKELGYSKNYKSIVKRDCRPLYDMYMKLGKEDIIHGIISYMEKSREYRLKMCDIRDIISKERGMTKFQKLLFKHNIYDDRKLKVDLRVHKLFTRVTEVPLDKKMRIDTFLKVEEVINFWDIIGKYNFHIEEL